MIVRSLDTSDLAGGAVTEGRLAAGSVDTAKFAAGATAPNAVRLAGAPADNYQARITGRCGTKGRAISAVGANGGVACTDRVVLPIAADPTPTRNAATNLAPSDLGLIEDCNGGGSGVVRFFNNGSQPGTLNWIFSQGGTTSTVNATGNVINPYPASIDFVYANRLEGQWIFSGGGAVTTVNLHAFNGGTSCEIRGTAVVAATG